MTPFDESGDDAPAGDKASMAGFAARLAAATGAAKVVESRSPQKAPPPAIRPAAPTEAGSDNAVVDAPAVAEPAAEQESTAAVAATAATQELEAADAVTAQPDEPQVDEPVADLAAVAASAAVTEAEVPAAETAIDSDEGHGREIVAKLVGIAAIMSASDPDAAADDNHEVPATAERVQVEAAAAAQTPEPVALAAEPEPEPVAAQPEPEQKPVVAADAAEPEPVAAVEPAPAPAPEPEAPAPEATPAPPVVDDVVAQPVWQMVAPDVEPAPAGPAIAATAAPAGPAAEPQWPTRPEWPAAGRAAGLPFLNRPAAPQGGIDALWAESSREVVAAPSPSGRQAGVVQPCVSCGLSLSATARFCRRCGASQGS